MSSFNSILDRFINAIPNVVLAALNLLIAWGAASILRALVKKGMNHWFSGRAATGSNEIKNSYSETVTLAGNITFAVTFFLFLPSALEKLGIESATSPISSVVSRFLGFLPNLIAAFILIAFGAFLAKLLSRILEKALKATALDSL